MRSIKKFLQTFVSNYAANGVYAARGVNDGNIAWVQITLPHSMAANDTLTVTVPTSQPAGLLPILVSPAYALSSVTYSMDTNALAITSHNVSTGVTVLTASGNLQAGDIVMVGYGPVAAIAG